MGVIAKNERLITLYTYPNHHLSSKCIAIAKASGAEINIIDIEKNKITGTIWSELASMLGLKIADLIAKNHPTFLEKYPKENSLEENDTIKLLQNSPQVLAYPIAVRGNRAVQAKNSTDILKLHKPDSKDAKLP